MAKEPCDNVQARHAAHVRPVRRAETVHGVLFFLQDVEVKERLLSWAKLLARANKIQAAIHFTGAFGRLVRALREPNHLCVGRWRRMHQNL